MSNNTKQIDLREALNNYLHSRSLSKSIATLLSSKRKKIDYKPDYQRNYVWDDVKATFFIESILLGVEIPPLILFAPSTDTKRLEVVDGRQRFETLKRFFEGDFTLKERGLNKLSQLAGSSYEKLDPIIKKTFTKTTLRTIEFSTKSTLPDHKRHEELEDKIKKEIFRRYNSGITPLKSLEVQKALHLGDSFTAIMKEDFENNEVWLKQFKDIFFSTSVKKDKNITDAEIQTKIRELLVLQYFPINIYSNTSKRKDLVEQLFYSFIESEDISDNQDFDDSLLNENSNQQKVFSSFIDKINLIHQLYLILQLPQWVIYQSIYWGLVIIESNDININDFFDPDIIQNLATFIKDNDHIATFTQLDRGLSQPTQDRFRLIAEYFNKALKEKSIDIVNFDIHLKNSMPESSSTEKQKDDENKANEELARERLIRPDAETTNIDDLIIDMKENDFLIRPAYQRAEVINAKKASGIIESMMLGIPLPTIFVYRRTDGICEVVDGQQRLLSILAFIGDSKYENDENDVSEKMHKLEESKKENYKLTKPLSILDVGGQRFSELPDDLQEKIWDFELSIVYIDQESNPNFDPIDLFIRLNNKPYPVKDPSFEMWNSYCNREIISEIQNLAKNNNDWFYYRKDNKRMEDEELLTIFSYLQSQFHKGKDESFNCVDIYQSSAYSMIFRLPKVKISEWLDKAEGHEDKAIANKNDVLDCISKTEQFIKKMDIIINFISNESEITKAQAYDELVNTKTKARNQRHFFILWYLLVDVDEDTIKSNEINIVNGIKDFLKNKQIVSEADRVNVKSIFQTNVTNFWKSV